MNVGVNEHGLSFRALMLCVALGGLLATGSGAGAVSAHAGPPLAVRVQRILHLPSGNHDYLRFIGRLIKASIPRGRPAAGARPIISAMVRQRTDLRGIVSAISRGASPVSLRHALLSRVTLNGAILTGNGPWWQYGTNYDNMLVQAALDNEARTLWKAGQLRRASRYARAALLLRCQAAFIEGWRTALFDYSRFGWARRYGSMVSKAEIQLVEKNRAGFRALLRLTNAQQMAIDRLYNASHRLAVRTGFIANFASLNDLTFAVLSDKRIAPKPSTVHYLHLLAKCAHTAPSLRWRMAVASFVYWARAQMAGTGGRANLVAGIGERLRRWRKAVRADHTLSTLERAALLRWIKEAMGP